MNKKILIADDHHVVRVGTSMILKSKINDISIDFAENYTEVKQKLASQKFDLVILDIDMPESTFKLMIKELKTIQEDLLIMIFSMYKDNVAMQYIREGAEGFLNKLSDEKTIVKAVNSIFEDGFYYPPQIISQIAKGKIGINVAEILSKREFQVFELLAIGNGNLEIANILDIKIPTVGTYKRRINEKLKINNIIELLNIYNEIH